MNDILSNWGLSGTTAVQIDSFSKSAWDIGGQYILKHYSNDDELYRVMQFTKLLNSYAIPTAKFLPTNDGQLTSPEGSYCLMTKLSGKHADFYEEFNLVSEMGHELARLHIALAQIGNNVTCNESDLLIDWQNDIKPCVEKLISDKMLNGIDLKFCKIYPNLPRQLIHRDVHCNNVLFDDGRLTGWLDFDISQRNVRLFDIAYLLGGLLYGNTSNPAKLKKWHLIYDNLLLGYDSVNPLLDSERDALPILMIMIELLFVWFWIGQGNTEQSETALELAKWIYSEFETTHV